MSSDLVRLELDAANRVDIHLHGATIISWISNNNEVLFVSKKAIFDNKKAIRGGIPVVFPNFGPWDNGRPQHGFARTKRWNIKEQEKNSEYASVKLSLVDDEETRNLWNFKFELIYYVTLKKNELITELIVNNKGETSFDFTALLHTYFSVDNIENAQVFDLSGCEYVDKVNNGKKETEVNDPLTIQGETDRVYIGTGSLHRINTGDKFITLVKKNFPDTVVWNPWIEKAKSMADFGDDEYKKMICVESGYVNERVVLESNKTISLLQIISIE